MHNRITGGSLVGKLHTLLSLRSKVNHYNQHLLNRFETVAASVNTIIAIRKDAASVSANSSRENQQP